MTPRAILPWPIPSLHLESAGVPPAESIGAIALRPVSANTILFLRGIGSPLFQTRNADGKVKQLDVADPETMSALLVYVYIQGAPLREVVVALRGGPARFDEAVALFAAGIPFDSLEVLTEQAVSGLAKVAEQCANLGKKSNHC